MIKWYSKNPHPLAMTTGNLVKLEKISKISLIKGEFLANYWMKTKIFIVVAENWKNSAIKISLKGPYTFFRKFVSIFF